MHRTRMAGDRQREVAEPAEPVDHAFARLRLQQPQGPRHQRAVDVRIDLGEVGGPERHAHPELRQAIVQGVRGRLRLVERMGAVRAARLQPPLHPVAGAEGAQGVQIRLRQRLQVAQDQHGDRVPRREFDLRQAVTQSHRGDQGAQRRQQGADPLRQHRAGLHVGHVAGLALVEAHQHLALLHHVAHRQAGPVPVTPGGPLQRPQDARRPDLGQMPEVVLQHPLLHGHLGGRVQMLHLAPPAGAGVQAEVRASRAHALRALAEHGHGLGLFPLVLAPRHAHGHALAGQCAVDEHDLAIVAPGHAPAVEVKRGDLEHVILCRHRIGLSGREKAARGRLVKRTAPAAVRAAALRPMLTPWAARSSRRSPSSARR